MQRRYNSLRRNPSGGLRGADMPKQGVFKAAERGRKLSDSAFREVRDRLRLELVELQQSVRAASRYPVIIVLAGVQGAGVVDSLNLLNTWMDPRWIRTHTFDTPSDEERERPLFWRYWRSLPPAGTIGLYLDGWYGEAIAGRCHGAPAADFTARLARIAHFERTLADEGALVVKVWLHIAEARQRRLAHIHSTDAAFGFRASDASWPQPAPYGPYTRAAARAVRLTDTPQTRWHVVDAADDNHRRAALLTILRDSLTAHAKAIRASDKADKKAIKIQKNAGKKAPMINRGPLARIDLSRKMSEVAYAKAFHTRQARLYELQKAARAQGLATIIAFEGWDAAGKGGAIRRITYALSARNYQVVPIAAPNEEERSYHYLWRFWRHVSRAGRMTLFDRSWYGRVLVERVEHLISGEAQRRAYGEINDFEQELTDHGTLLVKFWLHIDPEEQLRRFKEREKTPYKRWKITADDWRNRKNWPRYEAAINDMIRATSTRAAPWNLVPANDKQVARIMVFDIVIKALETALKGPRR